MVFDRVGVGTTTPGAATFKVGAGTTQLSVDGDGVGIGSTANGVKLRVIGDTRLSGNVIAGVVTGSFFHSDGSNLDNINVSAANGLMKMEFFTILLLDLLVLEHL